MGSSGNACPCSRLRRRRAKHLSAIGAAHRPFQTGMRRRGPVGRTLTGGAKLADVMRPRRMDAGMPASRARKKQRGKKVPCFFLNLQMPHLQSRVAATMRGKRPSPVVMLYARDAQQYTYVPRRALCDRSSMAVDATEFTARSTRLPSSIVCSFVQDTTWC